MNNIRTRGKTGKNRKITAIRRGNKNQGAPITAPASELAEILENKRLKRASTDRRVSFTDEPVPENLKRINAPQNDDTPEHDDVNVAILDTGIDTGHPALADNIAGGTSVVGSTIEDEAGHGTHVAGIIGADGDQSKISGVAPNANLYAVKVAGSESGGSLSNVIAGLDWVLDRDSHEQIDLVNMSLGSSSLPGEGLFKEAVQKTIQHNIPIVVSAGNDRSSVQNHSPAQYEGVITVSSLKEKSNNMSSFSLSRKYSCL